ncbi:MAG: type II toxin-antitoxin system RelE/ParE family toxin [Candidatus Peregrinibacteria bacterium]
MDKIKKFLLKLTKKERTLIKAILEDVLALSLQNYDVKPLKGYKGFYRLRKGDVRIIFAKEKTMGMIIDIDYRKDIYKK